LILPAPYTFQESIAAIKKFRPEVSPKLLYRVYDIVDTTLPFVERWKKVTAILSAATNPSLVPTTTVEVQNETELMRFHASSMNMGFEGTILRSLAGKYTPGHRSKDLLKLKDMHDAEFRITGFEDGVGKDAGAIVFHCLSDTGLEFKARPEGPIEERQKMFKKGKSYIGKLLTVRYQALSDTGVPIFPVGVTVRDYE
jgi:ATP-dependent DNA ligase